MNLIYKHTSKTSDKSYIGKSMKSMESRWNEHKREALKGVNTHFYKAIRKYGPDDFISSVLEDNILENELILRERYWIRYYNSFNEGYNSTEGGEGISGFTHSEETKKKMSLASKGIKKSEDHCLNIKKALNEISEETKIKKYKKQSLAIKGKKHSEETKKKISQKLKGVKKSSEHIAKSAASRKGLKRTAEQNKRNSLTHLGKKQTNETKEKISNSCKGRGCLIIEIFDKEHNLKYTVKDNFRTFCNEYNLPYDALCKSYSKKEKLYNTKQKLTFAKKKGLEGLEGWYAINKGKK